MDKTKKKGNIIILLIGIVFFVAFYFATSFVNRFIAQGLETGKIAQQDAIAYRNINGIFSQLQVLAAIVMVLFDRKRGFIVAIILEVLVAFNLLRSVIFSHNYMPLPGFFTALVSILIITVIHITLQRNDRLHEEVTENYEKLIEQNHMIEAKDKALTKLAYYDRLTGLPNSAFYNEKLQEIEDAHNKWLAEKSEADQRQQEEEAARGDEVTYSMRMGQEEEV
jgi:predicted signal transduction protein with EAL and GGDEF domain